MKTMLAFRNKDDWDSPSQYIFIRVNIMRIITSFPIEVNSPVNPIESPTVPKADITSNKITIKGAFSVMSNIKSAIKINIILIIEIASALNI